MKLQTRYSQPGSDEKKLNIKKLNIKSMLNLELLWTTIKYIVHYRSPYNIRKND